MGNDVQNDQEESQVVKSVIERGDFDTVYSSHLRLQVAGISIFQETK